jgi:transposase-like protein
VAVSITKERTPAELRVLARRERDGRVGARLLALANALDGMGRGAAARAEGMDRQTLRDWVHRYNVYGRPPPCKGVLPTWLASSVRAARVYPASHAA